MTTTAGLARTPLHDEHVRLGAKLVPFAGWQMPIRYAGTLSEHRAVRSGCGVFDVSHMGVLSIDGPAAEAALQRLLSNDLSRIQPGQAQYTLLTNEQGGIEDDLICYRNEDASFTLVVNAANRDRDMARLRDGLASDTSIEWVDTGILAIQGPHAPEVLGDLGVAIDDMPAFSHRRAAAFGGEVTVATTGYTGEPGAEILAAGDALQRLWAELVSDPRVVPCGLGARDTLRLEVCYPLHGSDIGPDTDAVGAGLGWTLGWGTGFVGEDTLQTIRDHGPQRRLQPLLMLDRLIPRPGCAVLDADGTPIGVVTSGTKSPMLGSGIALAWIDARFESGQTVGIDIRGRTGSAEIARRPLYNGETG